MGDRFFSMTTKTKRKENEKTGGNWSEVLLNLYQVTSRLKKRETLQKRESKYKKEKVKKKVKKVKTHNRLSSLKSLTPSDNNYERQVLLFVWSISKNK